MRFVCVVIACGCVVSDFDVCGYVVSFGCGSLQCEATVLQIFKYKTARN